MKPESRLASLDILRALAVILVLFGHQPLPAPSQMPEWLFHVLLKIERVGWMGVDLFFVLSGFLVSGLLFREWQRHGSLRWGRFWLRRAWKIYPPFYLMLAATVSLVWFRTGYFPPWNVVLSEMLFVQNYWLTLFNHTWSLAIEEHFYLLLPFMLWIASRGKGGGTFERLPWMILALAIAALAFRVELAARLDFNWRTHAVATHLRIDSLAFGVWISWLFHFRHEQLKNFWQRWRKVLLATAALLLLPVFWIRYGTGFYLHSFGFTAIYIACGIVLLEALFAEWKNRWLAAIGKQSYSIYLWHMTFLLLILKPAFGRDGGWTLWFCHFALSLGGGMLLGMAIETPFLRLRDRLFPSRSGIFKPK